MRHRMILAVFMIAGLACAGSQTNPGKAANDFSADMLPMAVGNSWTYTYTGMPRETQTVEFKIDDAKEFDEKKYYHFSRWFTLTLREDQGGAWLRYAGGEIFQRTDSGEEKLIGRDIENTELTVGPQKFETGAGRVEHADALYRTCVLCADAGGTFYFQKGKGIVQAHFSAIWGGASYKLQKSNVK